jgi:hypothetical protein
MQNESRIACEIAEANGAEATCLIKAAIIRPSVNGKHVMQRFQKMPGITVHKQKTYVFVLTFRGEDVVLWVAEHGIAYRILGLVRLYEQEIYAMSYDEDSNKALPREVIERATQLLTSEPKREEIKQQNDTLFRNSWVLPALAFGLIFVAYPTVTFLFSKKKVRSYVQVFTFIVYATYTRLCLQMVLKWLKHRIAPTQPVGMKWSFEHDMRITYVKHLLAVNDSIKVFIVCKALSVLLNLVFGTRSDVWKMWGVLWSMCDIAVYWVRGAQGNY